nr:MULTISPECIES: hypothetical protein [unclassified Bradyrhizobium]
MPAIVVGDEVVKSNALEEAAAFASAVGCPVYQQTIAYGAHFPSEHPCFVGALPRDQRQTAKILGARTAAAGDRRGSDRPCRSRYRQELSRGDRAEGRRQGDAARIGPRDRRSGRREARVRPHRGDRAEELGGEAREAGQ